MKKPNITPGPWRIAEKHEPFINIRALTQSTQHGYAKDYHGRIACALSDGVGEYKANAQAIAALPDLLDALEQARELVALCRPRFPKSVKNPDTFKLCLADAAINKALVKAGYTF